MLQVLKRLVQRRVAIFPFPDHATLIERTDDGCERTIVIVAQFNPAYGVDKIGDVWVEFLKCGCHRLAHFCVPSVFLYTGVIMQSTTPYELYGSPTDVRVMERIQP